MTTDSRDPFVLDAEDESRFETHLASTAGIFRQLASGIGATTWMGDKIEDWSRHPLSMGLTRLAAQGQLSPDSLRYGMARLQQVPVEIIKIIGEGGIAVDADGTSFSIDTDRGVSLALIPIDRDAVQAELEAHLSSATALLGDKWRSFIRPVSTLCIVEAVGYAQIPHYSGSSNSLFGAMQSGRLTESWITAEVLTHEAAHMWLSLIEDQEEFADDGWEDKSYLSPWRNDARPISGVIHGVYVFSMVAEMLACWVERGGPCIDNVSERLALVCAQVRSAAATVNGHPTVIPFVRTMTEDALHRIDACERLVSVEAINSASARLAEYNV